MLHSFPTPTLRLKEDLRVSFPILSLFCRRKRNTLKLKLILISGFSDSGCV